MPASSGRHKGLGLWFVATISALMVRRESAYRVHVPALIDVRAIRTKLGMTQEEFAGRFGFSVNTLRHWEQGKRQPEGPTRAYLIVIERAPKAVQKALHVA